MNTVRKLHTTKFPRRQDLNLYEHLDLVVHHPGIEVLVTIVWSFEIEDRPFADEVAEGHNSFVGHGDAPGLQAIIADDTFLCSNSSK